jgi:hypothetical protein
MFYRFHYVKTTVGKKVFNVSFYFLFVPGRFYMYGMKGWILFSITYDTSHIFLYFCFILAFYLPRYYIWDLDPLKFLKSEDLKFQNCSRWLHPKATIFLVNPTGVNQLFSIKKKKIKTTTAFLSPKFSFSPHLSLSHESHQAVSLSLINS